jgi:hypothetical protein
MEPAEAIDQYASWRNRTEPTQPESGVRRPWLFRDPRGPARS